MTHAENGQIALELFEESEENAFDAILMDIRMPLMDGLQATKSIRNLKCTDAKEVPIVAMTANAYEEDRRASLEAGMNEHLAKPVNPQELFRILEACMKERDAKVILRQKKMKSENNG